jgi:GT2 family glycosyltransferase
MESSILDRVALLVVHYNTPQQTLRCLISAKNFGIRHLFVLDNASEPDHRQHLEEALLDFGDELTYVVSSKNEGFAGGCNLLIEKALSGSGFDFVFLLNSDAWLNPAAQHDFITAMNQGPDMLAMRVHTPPSTEFPEGLPESLGLCCYRSLIVSNRKRLSDPCFGPMGGCAVFSCTLLQKLKDCHGVFFDPDYFCYAEDADMALRARLLGHACIYLDTVVAWHEGQASSTGCDFIVYHGMRNSFWTQMKSVPFFMLWRAFPWMVLMQAGLFAQLIVQGKPRLWWQIQRDVFRHLPVLLQKRKPIQKNQHTEKKALLQCWSRAFYDWDYFKKRWPFQKR